MFNANYKKKIIQLETELSANQSLSRALERSMAIIEFDVSGTILRANSNYLDLSGYRAEVLVGQHHRRLCPNTVIQNRDYSEFWARLSRGEFLSGTFQRLDAQGHTLWLEASYNPISDVNGKIVKVIKYALDVTRRVEFYNEAQSKLEALDQALARIEFDLEGRILTANENFLATVGYSLGEIQGQHHRLFCDPRLINSEEYVDFWRRLNAGELFRGQFKRLGKHSRTVWLEASYNPVYDVTGRLYKIVKYASDITERVEKNVSDGRSASRAYHISAETEKVAELGTQIIQAAASEMREIAENVSRSATEIAQLGVRSEQITAIVKTIRGIADQTNLLALNAAIEAARAGDQGRGFAVVADEVRQLAGRTSSATTEIAEMISKILSETRQAIISMESTQGRALKGVELADQAGAVIVQIRDGASDALDAVSMFANKIDESDIIHNATLSRADR
ncbi:PAS domain-containing methyl-accepting chemotaxis protein [Pseudomonas sp. CBMAI 2609]|uniref:PAS domain-containing methyl-accepting chemotaxis protein n=1 Tax=Pseudomonas flavocrustae TaxID=2991719 RepID=A0ABT6IIN0_9PSED|nr:PAS domain-containing methyl-accepting chemotaxis protein [Pseudomonas sp. CBMAI 2609]MDH4764128.1 PAS domain-containing methyl-accepting chemotaxis protein [Pseudomonas sp. CBMAI 2609]